MHCGGVLEAWDPSTQLWGACNDCQAWEAYLWCQRLPQPVAEAALRHWVADAIAAAFEPFQGGKAV
jgi:hypothetical protein